MDTRFWGPSGWRLLHSITFAYIPHTDKLAVRAMFETLPFVLPCKFCRKSLQEYMATDSLYPALESRDTLTRWLWRIHNEVNAKLRSQGTPVAPDPPFEQVEKFYKDLLSTGCSRTEFPGWDFLFSIADLHPMSKIARGSIPIPDSPPCETLQTAADKNRWNCLKPDERLPFYEMFWISIGLTLPFKEWRAAWMRPGLIKHSDTETRATTIKWLWSVRCSMEHELELLNGCRFSSLCKTLQKHRSGCSKSKRAITCRKNRNSK
jgi:hypothetical protein